MRRRFFISFENWPEKPAKRFEGQTFTALLRRAPVRMAR